MKGLLLLVVCIGICLGGCAMEQPVTPPDQPSTVWVDVEYQMMDDGTWAVND